MTFYGKPRRNKLLFLIWKCVFITQKLDIPLTDKCDEVSIYYSMEELKFIFLVHKEEVNKILDIIYRKTGGGYIM